MSFAPAGHSRPFWLLALLTGAGTLGIHVFAPALPLVARDLGTDVAGAQLTISLYMVGLACGQVVLGPLSDTFGRRPVLLCGLALLSTAAVLGALAPSLPWLVAARMLQAFGGCAGLVIGRAIVHDTETVQNATATIASLNSVLLISPAIAPVVGLWLATALGWRAIPLMLAAMGVASFAGAFFLLGETRGPRPASVPGRRPLAALASPAFVAAVIGGSLTTSSLFTLLSTSAFVLVDDLGRPQSETAYVYTVFIGGILVGSFIARQGVRGLSGDTLLLCACAVGAVGGLSLLAAALLGAAGLIGYIACGFLFAVMAGVAGPLALTGAVSAAPQMRGTAAGLYGFTQMMTGALCIVIAGHGRHVLTSSAAVLAFCGCAGFVVFAALRAIRRAGAATREGGPR